MAYIDRGKYGTLVNQADIIDNPCIDYDTFTNDIKIIFENYNNLVTGSNIKYASTWLLEKDMWLQAENGNVEADVEVLSRGRIINVNPGVANIGREQRYIHCYIVLGEFKETFIGVPITNMAYDNRTHQYYTRNIFEVELKNPTGSKPYTQFWVVKPSVADLRNICGYDKRRIIKNRLYTDKKYAPNTYLNAISNRLRETLAVLI